MCSTEDDLHLGLVATLRVVTMLEGSAEPACVQVPSSASLVSKSYSQFDGMGMRLKRRYFRSGNELRLTRLVGPNRQTELVCGDSHPPAVSTLWCLDSHFV